MLILLNFLVIAYLGSFYIINELIYNLYSYESIEVFTKHFLPGIKLLIPYSYASLLLCREPKPAEPAEELLFHPPICYPAYFEEAEQEYLRSIRDDHLLWILHASESQVIRESDLIEEENRLNSPLYVRCYRKFNIFDTLQYTIVYQQKMLGVLTLFRTNIDGAFSDDDMFYLRSLGLHLNAVVHRLCAFPSRTWETERLIGELRIQYQLTGREEQILTFLYDYRNNNEIAEALGISEHTLQKHLQNIFRKMHISSKWELLRLTRSHSYSSQ